MNKIGEWMSGGRTFLADVQVEVQKSSWPTRAELVSHTGIVVVFVLLLAAVVGVSDLVLGVLIRMLLG